MNKLYFSGGEIKHDSKHPSIKRRFSTFSRRKELKLWDWKNGSSDKGLVLVSQSSDLTYWKRFYSDKIVVVFESNDPYLLDKTRSVKQLFRGLFKYITRAHRYLEIDFKKTVRDLCSRADAVVVGHHMVYEMLKSSIPNIHLIPDYSVALTSRQKGDYNLSDNGEINIFWEGLGSSFLPFEEINRIFKPLIGYNFVFHFVTDLSFYAISDMYQKKYVFEVAKKMAPDFYKSFRFYQWSEFSFSNIGTMCDFGIIPLPFNNGINYYKPENKLVQMWRLGLPTITSAIPSYKKLNNESELKDCCYDDYEWRKCILRFIENKSQRERNARIGMGYVNLHYSDQVIDSKWQKVLDSLTAVRTNKQGN